MLGSDQARRRNLMDGLQEVGPGNAALCYFCMGLQIARGRRRLG